MFDFESKLRALVENYGLMLLLEQNEITEEFVVRFLIDEGLVDFDDYINVDEEMEELFINEQEPNEEQIYDAIRRQTILRKFVPVFMGSAYKNKGVQLLLDGVNRYF